MQIVHGKLDIFPTVFARDQAALFLILLTAQCLFDLAQEPTGRSLNLALMLVAHDTMDVPDISEYAGVALGAFDQILAVLVHLLPIIIIKDQFFLPPLKKENKCNSGNQRSFLSIIAFANRGKYDCNYYIYIFMLERGVKKQKMSKQGNKLNINLLFIQQVSLILSTQPILSAQRTRCSCKTILPRIFNFILITIQMHSKPTIIIRQIHKFPISVLWPWTFFNAISPCFLIFHFRNVGNYILFWELLRVKTQRIRFQSRVRAKTVAEEGKMFFVRENEEGKRKCIHQL